MYKSFEIKNFKCFRELKIQNMAQLNLITGVNDIGKTALLESIFIHAGTHNPELLLRINIFRGVELTKFKFGRSTDTPWASSFSDLNTDSIIKLSGNLENIGIRDVKIKIVNEQEELVRISKSIKYSTEEKPNQEENIRKLLLTSEVAQVLQIEYKDKDREGKRYIVADPAGIVMSVVPPSPFPVIFLPSKIRVTASEDADRFSKILSDRSEDMLLESLKIIEPRLTRLMLSVYCGETVIHGDIGILLPLPYMGDGISRLASIILAIANAHNGVVLIDEIENGLHYSVLQQVWRVIYGAAKRFNTQIFATTHSFECIAAAYNTLKESDEFLLHRLDRKNDEINIVTYDNESLDTSIKLGFEVR